MKNANTKLRASSVSKLRASSVSKSRVSSVSKLRASSVSKSRARLLTSWAAVSVLAASLLFIGLLTGCPQKVNEKPQEASKYNYKVEHLQQNIADNDYTLYETETLSGKAGETTSAAAKPYAGFTAQDFSQAAIKADSSTVVQIKYNRNIITLTLNLDGGTTSTELENGEGGTKILKGKYEADVKAVEDPTKAPGFLFLHWNPKLPSTFPAQSAKHTALWTDKCQITVKGDERTAISEDNIIQIPLSENKTWQDIQGDVANKVILKPEWSNGDYEIYEWRLDDENGTKLTGTEPINKHLTVYAVTNYTKFNIEGTKIKIIGDKGYNGSAPKGKIIIPDGITEIEGATSPSNGAFKDCTEISSVKFPQTLTTIGSHAFSDCTGLTSLDLSACASLTTIRANAFQGCTGLTSLDLSGCTSLTEIGGHAFYGCTGLTSLDPSGCTSLTKIDMWAFEGCTGLTGELKLPASLTEIAFSAFQNCRGLTSISFPASLTKIHDQAFMGCTGLTSLDLSACTSLNSIGTWAFYNCAGLTSLDLSACTSLTTIGRYAFCNCKDLTSISLPANLTTIGSSAFAGCTDLTSLDLSAYTSLTTIGGDAFSGCTGLTEIKLPASITYIGSYAFSDCTSLTSLTIDSANTKYKTEGNILYSKDGKTLIFAAGGLTSVNILDTVTEIGKKAFKNCSNLSGTIVFPANLKIIRSYYDYPKCEGAFENCTKLQGADFSACTNFTGIAGSTFKDCMGLTEVKLPASLTTIDKDAFFGCTELTSAVFADKEGWKVYYDNSYSDTPTSISSSDLADASKAAKYLRQTYVYKYWKKD